MVILLEEDAVGKCVQIYSKDFCIFYMAAQKLVYFLGQIYSSKRGCWIDFKYVL
jgi:hypothetical protein